MMPTHLNESLLWPRQLRKRPITSLTLIDYDKRAPTVMSQCYETAKMHQADLFYSRPPSNDSILCNFRLSPLHNGVQQPCQQCGSPSTLHWDQLNIAAIRQDQVSLSPFPSLTYHSIPASVGPRSWRPLIGSSTTSTERKLWSLRSALRPYKETSSANTPGTWSLWSQLQLWREKPRRKETTKKKGEEYRGRRTKSQQRKKSSHIKRKQTGGLHVECLVPLAKKSKWKYSVWEDGGNKDNRLAKFVDG